MAYPRIEQRLSPEAFAKLTMMLQCFEVQGYGPDVCVEMACSMVGLRPKPRTKTVLIVDHALRGDVWPFMSRTAVEAAVRERLEWRQ